MTHPGPNRPTTLARRLLQALQAPFRHPERPLDALARVHAKTLKDHHAQ